MDQEIRFIHTFRAHQDRLAGRTQSEKPHLSIDAFFSSLAEQRQSQAIGVLLSGIGSDGTLGLEAIKAGEG